MISIAVCDDDERILSEMKQAVAAYMDGRGLCFEIKLFPAAEVLLAEWQSFDLVFLDIRMGRMDGMQAARSIREKDCRCGLIFVTALKELVFDAFAVRADDYLLKPLSLDKLTGVLDRIITRLNAEDEQYLMIQKNGAIWRVRIADVYYGEVVKRIIYLHTTNGVKDYYESIERLEKLMPLQFFRCHRSYLLNLHRVQGFEDGRALLESGETVPVSRSRQTAFLQAMLQYMKGSKPHG